MEEEVHPGDRRSSQVLLLSEEPSQHEPVVTAVFPNVVERFEKHAPSAACRVVDRFTGLRIEDIHHEANDRPGRIELARLLVGEISELLDEVLVGVAEHVVRNRGVPKVHLTEVVDQVDKKRIGQPILVTPLDVAEYAIERVRIRFLDLAHSSLDGLPGVGTAGPEVRPVALGWNLEAVLLWQGRVLLVAVGLCKRCLAFLVEDVADPLQEQQRKDVCLEIGGIHGAAQDVCGIPQPGLQ